jgi:hypothetical protein
MQKPLMNNELEEKSGGPKPIRSSLPVFFPRMGGSPIPSLTNAEMDELFLLEDLGRWGFPVHDREPPKPDESP